MRRRAPPGRPQADAERGSCLRYVARGHEHAVLAVAEQVVRGTHPVRENERETAGGGLVDDDRPRLPLGEEREHVCGHVDL